VVKKAKRIEDLDGGDTFHTLVTVPIVSRSVETRVRGGVSENVTPGGT
jgi:hypothetical protein